MARIAIVGPLTAERSKPAVPIAGKYRLVDIPLSNCIKFKHHEDVCPTPVPNSVSCSNRYIKNTYNFSLFSNALSICWLLNRRISNVDYSRGTADAVRQSMHHFHDFKYALTFLGLIINGFNPVDREACWKEPGSPSLPYLYKWMKETTWYHEDWSWKYDH